jgi:hypothetical protein
MTSTPEPTCTTLGAPVAVAMDDLYGYPPYAAYGCRLAYVSSASGALVLRDLTTGGEQTIALASEKPRRPTIALDVVAWEATDAATGKSQVRAYYNGSATTIDGSFDHAGEPRAADGVIAFTAWSAAADTSDTDVLLYVAADGHSETVAGGFGQQRFCDVSATRVAITDFSEDPDGTFNDDGNDLADIGFFDRTLKTYGVRKNPGKDAFPSIVSDDAFGYLHWGDHRPEPKFQAFTIAGGLIAGPAAADKSIADVTTEIFVHPSGRYGEINWVVASTTDGTFTLNRAPVDGSSAASVVPGLDGTIGAPISAKGFTAVATIASGASTASLRAFAR